MRIELTEVETCMLGLVDTTTKHLEKRRQRAIARLRKIDAELSGTLSGAIGTISRARGVAIPPSVNYVVDEKGRGIMSWPDPPMSTEKKATQSNFDSLPADDLAAAIDRATPKLMPAMNGAPKE